MNERWTSPKAGPFPSGHLVVNSDVPFPSGWLTRCGLSAWAAKRCTYEMRLVQAAALTSEPPPTSEGPTCETCLRLANRDRIEDPIAGNDPEDDGSTQPVEMVP